MVNKTVGIRLGPVQSRNKVNHQNQFVPQAIILKTGKTTGWSTARLATRDFCNTNYNHIKYGGDRWETAVKPSAGCSWKSHRKDAEDEGVFDSGCSRSMTGNKERLNDFQEFQGGKVTFGGGEDTECLMLSKDFKLPDESMVVLRVPRKHNLYTINLNNLYPTGNLACLVAHASVDESVKWHRRMGHVNYKNMNRLVKGNLVIEHKDETYPILKDFINLVENQLNKKVIAMKCDNGTEFKNVHIIEFCGSRGIKREYSNARTLQKNEVAERKNRTLIEAARTMLADSKLPTMFWSEVVRTACYVLNRVLVTSPHNKTPYALLTGYIPSVSHFKPFGYHVTILNTSDHLGKFDGKADEGYIVGYSASNKAYRVYFDLDYLTDTLGYKHVQANQSAGTQEATTNPAGTQDVDSNSDCDEQVIIVPSYPSHNIQGIKPTDTSGDEVDDSPLNFADEIFQKELTRLKGHEQRATSDAERLGLGFANAAEELQKRASAKTVSTGSILVPIGNIPVPAGDTMVSTDDVPVHTSSPTDSFFNDEPTTRFPSPSDLGNHDPSPGIFSSLSYDDEFGSALNNVASTMKMDVKSGFLYGRINKEVYVTQPKGFVDPQHPKKVYKVVKALYGLHQAPRAWMATTPYEAPKPKSKNEFDSPVNVHLYKSMIGSLMYLTTSRPDIMFAVSACSRSQVTPTTSNLEAVKKIFKYLKGQPKLGLWYPRESPFVLEAYSDSDYARVNKDRKSTTGGCQFLGRRLILWQCKKQTIVVTSSTEAEYVVAANCCGQ
nr:ribonuclease H-like domain-containing protein [Tanacetum cinerariifolium]